MSMAPSALSKPGKIRNRPLHQFRVVGIDATADGRQAVKDGTPAMTGSRMRTGQGYGALKAASNLATGTTLNDGTDYELDETDISWVPFEPKDS